METQRCPDVVCHWPELRRAEEMRVPSSPRLFSCTSSTVTLSSFLFLSILVGQANSLKGRRVECVLKVGEWGTSFGRARMCLHSMGPRRGRAVSERHSVK